jgi:hypothetical protein
MMNLSAWIVLFCTVAISNTITVSAQGDDLCCLCDECHFPAPGRDNLNVDEFGTTCYQQLLSMADPENASKVGSQQCTNEINLHRRRCCDSTFNPIDIAVAPTPAPVINLPQGVEPYCDLCVDGRFPGNPKTVTAVLYIPGTPKCELLYYMGQRGLVEDRLCKPMQDYLEEACGCADAPQAQLVAPAPVPAPVPAANPNANPTANDVVELFVRKDLPSNAGVKNAAYKLSEGRVRGSGESRRVLLKGV